mgnify:CR=1 FL=1
MKLLIATQNQHKLEEFRRLFATVPLIGLDQFPRFIMPEETGETFQENALIKAQAGFDQTGVPTLADDSGLVVEALNGRPGVHSARYVEGTDKDRYLALLQEMVGQSNRGAFFTTVLALVGAETSKPVAQPLKRVGHAIVTQGYVHGAIADTAAGVNGFGYDPIFRLPSGENMAELSPEEKMRCSHRGEAAGFMAPFLRKIF